MEDKKRAIKLILFIVAVVVLAVILALFKPAFLQYSIEQDNRRGANQIIEYLQSIDDPEEKQHMINEFVAFSTSMTPEILNEVTK